MRRDQTGMEQEMRELYIEGVAIHGGPESCVGVREDGGEALAGVVQAGLLSREITDSGVPTPSHQAEGHITCGASASRWWTLRGHGNLGMHEILHAREPGDPVVARQWRQCGPAAGRGGNAEAVIP